MKKLLLLLFVTLIAKTYAQTDPPYRICATPDLPPEYETWVSSLAPGKGKYGSGNTQSVFNIPVIVHIIHNNNEPVNSAVATTGNNLNAAQVIDQIRILNQDFNGLNPDTSLIPSVFKPLIGRFQINFCLAVVNPTGGILPEPGIDRINRTSKGWNSLPYSSTYINSTVKPNSIWDPNRYFNMWVVPMSGGVLGFATFPHPGTSGLQGLTSAIGTNMTDGVVIASTMFGSIGTAQSGVYNKGRTTTHEVGHWLGLRHIWGDANCGNDFCNDTPPAQSSNYGCPSSPHRLGVCSGNTTGEMTMNYMDYTNDACMYMFTADQKNRAQLIMVNSPIRKALTTSTVCNLPATTDDVGISFVVQPTYSQSINCVDHISPVLNVTNYGSNTLTSATFSFDVDGVNTQTLAWTGVVVPNTSFTLALPQIGGLGFGPHLFNVTVSSPNGGTDSNPSNNTSQQQFSLVNNFNFTAPSGAICQGGSIVLTASGASSYSWSTGANTASVSLSPSATTQYTVTGYSGLCEVAKTVTVTLQNPPVVVLSRTSVCEGVPTIVTASGANSYTWSSGQISASVHLTLTASTDYTVSASTSAGCVNTQTFNIQVNPAPVVQIPNSATVSCASCSDATLTSMASGGTAPYTYTWTPGNIKAQDAPDLAAGCYTLRVTDAAGCPASATACVVVDEGVPTGISALQSTSSEARISPNPGYGLYTIEFSSEEPVSLEVTDALGKVIYSARLATRSGTLDLTAYPQGIYYVRILSAESVSTRKLIKE